MGNLSPRLHRLEILWQRPTTCPTCHDYPYRLVATDELTGAEVAATMPADGCPTCGRSVVREIVLVGATAAELEMFV